MAMLLVHFKSRDLTRLQAQGQFWHIYFTTLSVIIAQDEVDTWTIHIPISLDTNVDELDPVEQIYKGLGGSGEPYPIKIDKILVKSSWRPNLAVADTYRSSGGRVFLAGDSGECSISSSKWRPKLVIAHQNIPTGGYGMNMGLGDAYDIGWKLAAVLNGWGGENLLKSYTSERRPVALRNVDRSGVFISVHQKTVEMASEIGHDRILTNTDEAEGLKARIKEHVSMNDGENKDHGMEMDYRVYDSPVTLDGNHEVEHPWNPRTYFPTTRPGSRAPHVFLKDGKTSIFDLYGPEYTVVDFTKEGRPSTRFEKLAKKLGIPLQCRLLPDEWYVRKIWERDVVIVRPDGFVTWRCDESAPALLADDEAEMILQVAVGRAESNHQADDIASTEKLNGPINGIAFTASGGNINLDNTDRITLLGEFQK
jgi:hypothetical protein